MQLMFDAKAVRLYRDDGPDQIVITLNDKTGFPALGMNTMAVINVQHGTGEEWCRRVLGLSVEARDQR